MRLIAIVAVILTVFCTEGSALGHPDGVAPTAAESAKISVVASQSFCIPTGISDIYTGDGKVTFYITLRNTGSSAGKVNITPVRHYDDGQFNASAMDTLIDVAVPARSVKKYRSPAYSYKAHQHDVIGCGLMIGAGKEVHIRVVG